MYEDKHQLDEYMNDLPSVKICIRVKPLEKNLRKIKKVSKRPPNRLNLSILLLTLTL